MPTPVRVAADPVVQVRPGEGRDPGRWGDLAGAKNAGLDLGERGGLHDGAGAAGQGDGVQSAELALGPSPGQAGAAFRDADEQQRQPAQQYVRPDAGVRRGGTPAVVQTADDVLELPTAVATNCSTAESLPLRPPVTGGIRGRAIACCSAKQHVEMHLGYEPCRQDPADMALLATEFGVDLPPPYGKDV